jgi:hypothetical protein
MLPRRCKKCRCYVAPQLSRCPRCNKLAPPLKSVTKPTKEEKAEARVKRDAKAPIIQGKNIHWVPSEFTVQAHKAMVNELERRLAKADTPRMRNTIRSEMRAVKATLARVVVPSGKKPWTSEIFHGKQSCISIFISPKNHRYVTASRDGPADLIIESRKKHRRSIPFVRLQRFEKSPYARMAKKEKQEDVVHRKRKKAKKERREKKRKLTRKHADE